MAEAKKRMKSIGWPEIDADALASSYILKVLTTLGKWSAKMAGLKHELNDFEQTEQVVKLLSCTGNILGQVFYWGFSMRLTIQS